MLLTRVVVYEVVLLANVGPIVLVGVYWHRGGTPTDLASNYLVLGMHRIFGRAVYSMGCASTVEGVIDSNWQYPRYMW